MLELLVLVQSSKRKILPLFFGLSCKQFGDAKRRERWFQKWDKWAEIDSRVSVEDWKLALQEVDWRQGLEYKAAVGEVEFRKEVLATVSGLVRPHVLFFNKLRVLSRLLSTRPCTTFKDIGVIVTYVVFVILFYFLCLKVILPIIESLIYPEKFSKSLLTLGNQLCQNMSDGFFNN